MTNKDMVPRPGPGPAPRARTLPQQLRPTGPTAPPQPGVNGPFIDPPDSPQLRPSQDRK
jgi:hypothetical protein